jgi:CheY-like chemotaxis protein
MEGRVNADGGCVVLIVEDDPSIVEFVDAILHDEGYQVEAASDGQEGLRRVGEAAPDLILLDLLLPVMSGEAFLRELRRRVGTAIPVILMTATRDAGPSDAAPAEGVLLKPFELNALLAEVGRVLAGRPCAVR